MHKLKDTTQDEMVATFLKSEINSKRFGQHIIERLKRDNKNRAIIDNPDLVDSSDNHYRIQLLGEYRGYGQNKLLFENFPTNVRWEYVSLSREDLKRIKYIKYDYWTKLSQGTRFAKDAVETIEKGTEIFDESNEPFLKAAKAVVAGLIFPEMILIAVDTTEDIVVVEGHLRLTAYLLAKDKAPDEVEAIIGYSPEIINWGLY